RELAHAGGDGNTDLGDCRDYPAALCPCDVRRVHRSALASEGLGAHHRRAGPISMALPDTSLRFLDWELILSGQLGSRICPGTHGGCFRPRLADSQLQRGETVTAHTRVGRPGAVERLVPSVSLAGAPAAVYLSDRPDARLHPIHSGSWPVCAACATVLDGPVGGSFGTDRYSLGVSASSASSSHEAVNPMGYDLTRSQFNRLVRAYQPSRYETFGAQDARFSAPMHHALKCRYRLHVALRSGLQRLPDGPQTIVDFG